MKQYIPLILIAAVALFALSSSGVASSLLIFLLLGVVPGTTYAISPFIMLLITMSLLWLVMLHLTSRSAAALQTTRLFIRLTSRKQQLPRRRFGRSSAV